MINIDLDTKFIREIHDSHAYGSFYDLGTDMGLYTALWREPGASKTIAQYNAIYAKERQDHELPSLPHIRSVSAEKVTQIVRKWYFEKEGVQTLQKENLCFAASWQVGAGICNHGWIAIYYKGIFGLFHATVIPYAKTGIVKQIKSDRITGGSNASFVHQHLLHYMITANENSLAELSNIDIAYVGPFDLENLKLKPNFDVLFTTMFQKYVVFDVKSQTFIRLEDALRGSERALIYKGSFNPFHEGHKKLIEESKKLYPNAPVVINISPVNFDSSKRMRFNEELVERLNSLRHLGVCDYILINNEPMFIGTQMMLKNRLLDFKPIFIVGKDTYDRVEKENLNRIGFLVYPRDESDISSTKIRSQPCACGLKYEVCTKYFDGCAENDEKNLEFTYEQRYH